MNKKIVFSLFLLFICLFSCSSVFASISSTDFFNLLSQDGYSGDSSKCMNAINNSLSRKNLWIYRLETSRNEIVVASSDYEGSYNLERYSSLIRMSLDFSDDNLWCYYISINNTTLTYFDSISSGFSYGPTFLSYNSSYPPLSLDPTLTQDTFFSFDYVKTKLLERTYYLDYDLYYNGQLILTPEEVYNYRNGIVEYEAPTIEISKTEYTELDNDVYLYVYPNGFDITNYDFKLLTYIDGLEDRVPVSHYFSPGTQSRFDAYYNSGESRYEILVNDFIDFKFSDEIIYKIGIREFTSDGNDICSMFTDYFKVKFGDTYVVDPGGSFDITPKISLNTYDSTTSVIVSISCDVPDASIYYKMGESVWLHYEEPFVIDFNCVIYAHAWGEFSASGYSSLIVNNIVSDYEFENHRPIISLDDINVTRPTAVADYVLVKWFLNDNSSYVWQFSTDGYNYFDFRSSSEFVVGFPNFYLKTVTLKNSPFTLYFRYFDESSGLYSDTLPILVNGSDIKDFPSVPSYDDENTYIPGSTEDFNDKLYDELFSGDLGLDFSSSDKLLDTAWNSVNSTWLMFSNFFNLIRGIWIFIPYEIMYLIVSLIIIKFIIALIGFLRG